MFLLIQVVVMAGGVKLYDMIKGAGSTNLLTNGNLMVGLTLLNSVVVGAVFMALRWSPFSRSYMQKRPWAVLIWTALLALGSIPLADALSSLTNVKMPAEELQLLTTLVTHPWGWIAVGVLVQLYLQSAPGNFAVISAAAALLVLSCDWLFFYRMPGYSGSAQRYLWFVLPSAALTIPASLVEFAIVRHIYNKFKIDNGVV